MALYGTISSGVVRRAGDTVDLLDLPHPDLGAALAAGLTATELAVTPARETLPLTDVQLLAPVPRPGSVWLGGLSYRSHVLDMQDEMPAYPPIGGCSPSAITGPTDPIVLPAIAPDNVDYEGEVAVVIGRTGKHIVPSEGWHYVFGVTACQDVSARDVQAGRFMPSNRPDDAKGKSFDSFLPVGPWVATPEEFADRDDIGMRVYVDDELRQDARTSDLLYPIPEFVAFLSKFVTLRPGNLVLTGTPGGVGYPTKRFLRPGNRVRTEVEVIGTLDNPVIAETVK